MSGWVGGAFGDKGDGEGERDDERVGRGGVGVDGDLVEAVGVYEAVSGVNWNWEVCVEVSKESCWIGYYGAYLPGHLRAC